MWEYNLALIFIVIMCFVAGLQDNPNYVSCGLDFTGISHVYQGKGQLESYPWLGILFYPLGPARVTSVVVLVTRQMVIGSSSEIDKVPKDDFRANARVVLGTNCTGSSVRIREYTYHPEFRTKTYSTLVMVQLEVDHVKFELYPICGPPSHFIDMRIYAFTLNEDCEYPVVRIHEMEYVEEKECVQFYRRSGLDESSLWPTQWTCARAVSGGECVWRGGAALAAKLGDRWHLLGFGVYGPGCSAPARFMDYVPYAPWVRRNVARIGRPAITRLGPRHIILRRTISSLQRYGECDKEEVQKEIYTDRFTITETSTHIRRIRYNVSLYDEVEYSCVVFRVFHDTRHRAPSMRLRRWCSGSTNMCFGFQFIQIDFYVEIEFIGPMIFKMSAYGRRPTVIDPRQAMLFANKGITWQMVGAGSKLKKYIQSHKTMFWLNTEINVKEGPWLYGLVNYNLDNLQSSSSTSTVLP